MSENAGVIHDREVEVEDSDARTKLQEWLDDGVHKWKAVVGEDLLGGYAKLNEPKVVLVVCPRCEGVCWDVDLCIEQGRDQIDDPVDSYPCDICLGKGTVPRGTIDERKLGDPPYSETHSD